jgi:hypothetical protein
MLQHSGVYISKFWSHHTYIYIAFLFGNKNTHKLGHKGAGASPINKNTHNVLQNCSRTGERIFFSVMPGTGHLSARTVPVVQHNPTTAYSLGLVSNRFKKKKKKKKTFLSLSLPPLHHNALQLPLRPSGPQCGCHSASLLRRPHLVPLTHTRASASRHLRWCWWCSLRPSREPPTWPSQV